jgi:hypothetical protein
MGGQGKSTGFNRRKYWISPIEVGTGTSAICMQFLHDLGQQEMMGFHTLLLCSGTDSLFATTGSERFSFQQDSPAVTGLQRKVSGPIGFCLLVLS